MAVAQPGQSSGLQNRRPKVRILPAIPAAYRRRVLRRRAGGGTGGRNRLKTGRRKALELEPLPAHSSGARRSAPDGRRGGAVLQLLRSLRQALPVAVKDVREAVAIRCPPGSTAGVRDLQGSSITMLSMLCMPCRAVSATVSDAFASRPHASIALRGYRYLSCSLTYRTSDTALKKRL